jgi:hypothetical protein
MTYSIYTRQTNADTEINSTLTGLGFPAVTNLQRKLSLTEFDDTILGLLSVSLNASTNSISVTNVGTINVEDINDVISSTMFFVFENVIEDVIPISVYVKVIDPFITTNYGIELDVIFSPHIEDTNVVVAMGLVGVAINPLSSGKFSVYLTHIPA